MEFSSMGLIGESCTFVSLPQKCVRPGFLLTAESFFLSFFRTQFWMTAELQQKLDGIKS